MLKKILNTIISVAIIILLIAPVYAVSNPAYPVIKHTFENPAEAADWQVWGTPTGSMSIENGELKLTSTGPFTDIAAYYNNQVAKDFTAEFEIRTPEGAENDAATFIYRADSATNGYQIYFVRCPEARPRYFIKFAERPYNELKSGVFFPDWAEDDLNYATDSIKVKVVVSGGMHQIFTARADEEFGETPVMTYDETTEGDNTIKYDRYGYMGFLQWHDANERTVTSYYDNFIVTCEDEAESPSVGLSLSGSDFVVSITGWNSTHKYQIWTYQKTTSDIFGGEGATNQWVLSHSYTLGSARFPDDPNGFTVNGDAITRNIGSFESVDDKYTVAVKVIDAYGNFIGQFKDTFTPAQVDKVVISKVTVDGAFADDKAFVKDIANDSPVKFVVTGNGVEGTEYTAKIDQTGADLASSGAGNEFSWDISGMQPGNYSVTLTATKDTSSDSRTVNIKLYKNDPTIEYGQQTGLTVTGAAENDKFKIDINPTVTGGKFRYRISEPWRGTIAGGDSGLMEIPAAPLSNTAIPKTAYGVYEVRTYTYRNGVSSADDGAIRTVNNARPGGSGTLNVTVGGVPAGAEIITKAKGTPIELTPEATGIPAPAEYSFWRRDANGWVLVRDYSTEGLTWTPNRVGLYTIQVRAKEAGRLTYEVLKNIEFEITDGTDKKAVVTGITINQAALDTGAKARTPILIKANATSAEQDLLYKFIISNGYIYYVETAYSADPTYMWVPGKSGNYTINVLVKNQASFGKYDAVETFTVTVQ